MYEVSKVAIVFYFSPELYKAIVSKAPRYKYNYLTVL